MSIGLDWVLDIIYPWLVPGCVITTDVFYKRFVQQNDVSFLYD